MIERVLVTGGAGFIGSHVAEVLIADGYEVTVLDDLSGGWYENVPRPCEFVEASVLNKYGLVSLFLNHQFDYVFHFAAYASEHRSHELRSHTLRTNVVGSANLIEQAIATGVRRFVFASSVAVYGDMLGPMTEDVTPAPIDPYGISKFATELDLATAWAKYGLNATVFRMHNVYGPRQNIWDEDRNVIGIFMRQILSGRPLTIVGDGEQTRAFTYIDDVAPLIARSIKNDDAVNGTYNIGSDTAYSINHLARVVCRAMGDGSCAIEHVPERYEAKHTDVCHTLARDVFGYSTDTPLEHGVNEMANWVRGKT